MRITRLLIVLVSLTVGLCVAELLAARFYKKTFSVVGWKADIQQDNELVYSLRPNRDIVWQRYGMEMNFHTNNFGFRGTQDIVVPKPRGVFRILMAGDSFVFGDGLSDSETISHIIREKLAKAELSDVSVEVINMGVPGYSPDQSYRQLMQSIANFQPDLVIWNFISWHINGMVNNTGQQYYRPSLYTVNDGALKALDARWNKIYVHNSLLGFAPPLLKNSYLFDLVLNRLFFSSLFSGIPNLSREDKLDWAKKKLVLEIASLNRFAKVNGCEFMFVVLPSLDGLSNSTNGEFISFLNEVKNSLDHQPPVLFIDINAELFALLNDDSETPDSMKLRVLGTGRLSPEALFFDAPNEHPNRLGASVSADLLVTHVRSLITNRTR